MIWPLSSPFELTAVEVHALDRSFDYIIVGGGASGAIIASRLSADPNISVLVIERGPVNDGWWSGVPTLSSSLFMKGAPAAYWNMSPIDRSKNQILRAVVGEGLGGGTRVNSCIYTRGCGDYNLWKEMGHSGWGYDDLLPFFKKSERRIGEGPSEYHSTTGPMANQKATPMLNVFKHVEMAANKVGIPSIPDFNLPTAPAVCHTQLDLTIDESARRCSTARTFLPTALVNSRSANLVICANTLVSRIRFSTHTARPTTTGVLFKSADVKKDPRTYQATLKAGGEVILCSGAIGSPHVLLLSGIGPKAHLEQNGINVVKDMPGVGSHLKDHHGVPLHYEVPLHDSINLYIAKPWLILLALFQYLFFGTGLLSAPAVPTAIFFRSSLIDSSYKIKDNIEPRELDQSRTTNIPDIEIMPIPICVSAYPDEDTHFMNTEYLHKRRGVMTLFVCILKPKSSGTVRLVSADPHERASVTLGALSDQRDVPVLRQGVRLGMSIAEKMRESGYNIQAIPNEQPVSRREEDVDGFIESEVRTALHYASTCRMGREDDPEAPGVVDDKLKVHGVDGLRVADASIFPDIVAAHIMAPSMMVGEKCADMLLASRKIS